MIKRLTSLQNETVKKAASLQQKKYRQREGLFLVEGVRAVREVRSSAWTVTAYFFTDLPEDFQKEAQTSDIPYYEVTGDIMKKLTATEEPQSLAALVRLEERRLETVHPGKGLILVLDEIHDPGNVGTMIRTARAMNAEGVILLCGSADLYNPKVVRAAMGNLFHIPVFTGITEDVLMDFAQKEGWTLVATALEGAVDLRKFTYPSKTLLIMGSEAEGVSSSLLEKSAARVKIPMLGEAESLNVGVAAGILLYEAMVQQGLKGK
ncbi:MAG: RNA methyltransferase [Acidaminococcus sp.]|jgi:TrmH family RNA methyltransferase|uniref:RNA methyltransferase n=1 Tax=Acidaminococcus intestini TaxID=187327 RepID=A0A943EF50_9FIRM|nr:RNA methyltransferase [Acidaminococcus sp.]MBS5519009.1 RNA methyltransferase [Acidaminococcus intestini]MDY2739225.1 RNA methyltransferase [Acidaminococcus sp.]